MALRTVFVINWTSKYKCNILHMPTTNTTIFLRRNVTMALLKLCFSIANIIDSATKRMLLLCCNLVRCRIVVLFVNINVFYCSNYKLQNDDTVVNWACWEQSPINLKRFSKIFLYLKVVLQPWKFSLANVSFPENVYVHICFYT